MEQDGLVARLLHEVAMAKAGVAASYARLWRRPGEPDGAPISPTVVQDAESSICTDAGAAADTEDQQPSG